MTRFISRITLSLAALALVAGTAAPVQAQGKDIVQTAVDAGQFKTLAAAL